MKNNDVAEKTEKTTASPPLKWYHIDRDFLSIKLIYFWMYGAAMAVLPLLTLHMQHIGLTLADVAQVYVFMPVAAFMGPPVMGYIADRTGRIRELYVGCLILCCAVHNALYFFVPVSPGTTPAALARHRASHEFPCTDWVLPQCGNFSSDLQCRLSCPEPTEGVFTSCTNDSSCFVQPPHVKLHLPVTSKGCVDQPRLVSNVSESVLPATNITCPADCKIRCKSEGPLPLSDRKTFWSYFAIRLVSTFFLAPSFTLLDATNLALVKQHQTPGQNFGRQRVSGIAASIIIPPLVGVLIDVVSGSGPTHYATAFYAMDICAAIAVLMIVVSKMYIALPEKAHIRQAGQVLKRPEALVFILVVAILGAMWGFLENFLFVFLRQLKAPNYLLGLTLTISGMASIPFNWWSDAICRKVGHVNVLIIAFFGYAIRYLGYSFMTNPWLCMPFELLEVVTTHLMWNSAATYAGHLAPPGLLATLIGLAGALHYSFGRGVGSFIGGYLMALEGAAYTYRAMATVSGVSGVLYMTVYYGFLKRRISRREQRAREKAEATAKDGFGEGPHELAAMLEENAISGV